MPPPVSHHPLLSFPMRPLREQWEQLTVSDKQLRLCGLLDGVLCVVFLTLGVLTILERKLVTCCCFSPVLIAKFDLFWTSPRSVHVLLSSRAVGPLICGYLFTFSLHQNKWPLDSSLVFSFIGTGFYNTHIILNIVPS